ncbi:hypothetical protein [Paraburkholderia adhaesiva]|uniref:hypothetical protein n=1 Tax=Paraburkholderia adhaesiva TaxID=2883244 RepID=UPI001F2B6B15|nr:hypothetical protein [Paraburkholderia adhaesiva]
MKLTTAMLALLTAQDVFDFVACELLRQNARALSGSRCRYRAPDGRRCAVGFVIPDEEYRAQFEGGGVVNMIRVAHLLGCSSGFTRFLLAHQSLLGYLQHMHDEHPADAWPLLLREIASLFGLHAREVERWRAGHAARESVTVDAQPEVPGFACTRWREFITELLAGSVSAYMLFDPALAGSASPVVMQCEVSRETVCT